MFASAYDRFVEISEECTVAIRQPFYLDIDLLQNTADYLDVGYPVETKIREKGASERTGGAGLGLPGTGVAVKGSRGSSDEVERTFDVPVRPVKVLNDVLDAALKNGEVKDCTVSEPDWSVVRRDLVQLEGEASLSDASAVGGILTELIPLMTPMLAQQNPGGPPPEFIAAMLGANSAERPLLYDLAVEGAPVGCMVQVDPAWFHRNSTAEDIAGEVSVFGVVDQLVPEGAEFDLTRFLLPGMNRVARKAITPSSFSDLLTSLGQGNATLTVEGPLWIIRPIGIF